MTTPKKSPGRPEHVPTDAQRRQVELMAAFGNTQEQIATLIGVTIPTLTKHYATELEMGLTKMVNSVASNLLRQATKDDFKSVPAAVALLKMKGGWSEFDPAPSGGPKQEKLGKKEERDIAAQDAERGTAWADVMH
jgi:hypothetical protein